VKGKKLKFSGIRNEKYVNEIQQMDTQCAQDGGQDPS
jgi:hypothetical protein